MSLTVNASGGGEDFPKLQPGKYEGTCFRIVDLGTSEQEYKGQVSKKKRIRLDFEITKAVDPAERNKNAGRETVWCWQDLHRIFV